MAGPLKGITVVEMAGIGPGPFAGMMLADMGARVIRVDRLPSPSKGGGVEALMKNDNVVDRGRESIALDLKSAHGVQAVLALVERADILIEGYRPGVMERLGLGPEPCHARNPRLVYGRMTGWGQSGPLAQAAGHDLNYIAISGALHAIGPAHLPPVPPLNLVGDYGGGGMLLLAGVLAAVIEARSSGHGQVVDAAMSDGAATLMAPQYGLAAKGHWHEARASNFLDGSAPFYGTYECAGGGYVALGPIEPQFLAEFMRRAGIDAATFGPQWDRARWPDQRLALEALFRTRSREAWCELLEGSEACFAPVLSMREAPAHPHNVARATFAAPGGVVQPAPAPRFGRTQGGLPPPSPEAGAHTAAILAELGLGGAP